MVRDERLQMMEDRSKKMNEEGSDMTRKDWLKLLLVYLPLILVGLAVATYAIMWIMLHVMLPIAVGVIIFIAFMVELLKERK